MIYLDNAATTRKKPYSVYAAMLRYALLVGGNAGRGVNGLSLGGINTILSAQESAARLLGAAEESNIIFTHNATYALNMAILGTLTPDDHIVVTAMEHNSVLRPAALHGNYSVAAADRHGCTSALAVRKCIKPTTKLVVSTHVSNVCGSIQPVKEIAHAAHEAGALFLLDASQSAGTMDVSMQDINADMLACPGHKGLMGPMGTGILCIKEPQKVKAVIVGGTGSDSESLTQPDSMPDKFHSGTVNAPALAGLKQGIDFVLRETPQAIAEHEHMLNTMFRDKLREIKSATIYGKNDTGITAFNIGNIPCEEVTRSLGEKIIVRAGYHCAPLAHKALGTADRGSVRVSFGYFNTKKDVDRIINALYKIS